MYASSLTHCDFLQNNLSRLPLKRDDKLTTFRLLCPTALRLRVAKATENIELPLALMNNYDLVTIKYTYVFIHLSAKCVRVLVRVLKRGHCRAEDALRGTHRQQTQESRGVSSPKRLQEKV